MVSTEFSQTSICFPHFSLMAMKRARTSSAGGSSSSDTSVTTIKLSGGWALPPSLVSLWRSGLLTDTVVTVEGRSFVADKKVLASSSEYFRSHFLNEQMERGAVNPTLQEHVSAAAFEPLLDFLYEGECTFDETRLTEVLQAASFLTVTPLEQAAVAALTERLSPSNALAAWSLADQLSLPELAEAAKETALKTFDEVEKIAEATLAQMQALVADDRLTATSEEAVFSAVARFAEAKQPDEAELLGLLRNVRFPLMSADFLHETVRSWSMLDTKEGHKLLFEMCMPRVRGPAQQPRVGFGARFLYMMGGERDGEGLSAVEIYEVQANTWTTGTPMPTGRSQQAAAELDGKIYMVGGHPANSNVTVFDQRTGTWSAVARMAQSRKASVAAVVGGKLYAIGGEDDDELLRSVEAFDPQTGAWAEVVPMPSARSFAGAAVLDGKIYVLGGDSNVDANDAVEVYDPQTDTWATAPTMSSARSGHGVAVLGGKIYAAGGLGGLGGHYLSSVEAYDPQTNNWQEVASMSTARNLTCLTAAQGKLYAVGGKGKDGNLATVEAYDPQQDRWEAVAPMARERRCAAVCCI